MDMDTERIVDQITNNPVLHKNVLLLVQDAIKLADEPNSNKTFNSVYNSPEFIASMFIVAETLSELTKAEQYKLVAAITILFLECE